MQSVRTNAASISSEPAPQLKKVLLRIGKTLSVAESLTGGQLQTRITAVNGASDFFDGGVTAYNIDHKVNLLGVDRKHAESVNCVSERVAREMVLGVRKLFGSFVGLSTTGYAEPSLKGQAAEPYAFYAIDIGGWTTAGRIEGRGHSRVDMQHFVADEVLRILIETFDELVRLAVAPKALATIQQQLRNDMNP